MKVTGNDQKWNRIKSTQLVRQVLIALSVMRFSSNSFTIYQCLAENPIFPHWARHTLLSLLACFIETSDSKLPICRFFQTSDQARTHNEALSRWCKLNS